MSFRDRESFSRENCSMNAFEDAKVSVPVTVRAFCDTRSPRVECRDNYIIRNRHETPGEPFAVSRFTVVQDLHLEIPMGFRAEAEVGEAFVHYSSCNKRDCEKCDCEK